MKATIEQLANDCREETSLIPRVVEPITRFTRRASGKRAKREIAREKEAIEILARIAQEELEDVRWTLDDLRAKRVPKLALNTQRTIIQRALGNGISLSAIGRFLRKDHGTIRHAMKQRAG